MALVNPELLRLATELVKQANPMAGGAAPPPAPAPVPAPAPAPDPAAQGAPPGGPQIPGMDPMTAMMGSPQAPAQPAAPPKLKPEQMMQMLDMRMYNMQQQLTAIAHAVGAKIDMGALVLPPGMQGAPPAETAVPGGPMDPMQSPDVQPGGPGAPPGGDPAAAGGPGVPGAAPGPAMPKTAFLLDGQLFQPADVTTGPNPLGRSKELANAIGAILRHAE